MSRYYQPGAAAQPSISLTNNGFTIGSHDQGPVLPRQRHGSDLFQATMREADLIPVVLNDLSLFSGVGLTHRTCWPPCAGLH